MRVEVNRRPDLALFKTVQVESSGRHLHVCKNMLLESVPMKARASGALVGKCDKCKMLFVNMKNKVTRGRIEL